MTVRKGLFSFLLEKKNVQNRKAQVVFTQEKTAWTLWFISCITAGAKDIYPGRSWERREDCKILGADEDARTTKE